MHSKLCLAMVELAHSHLIAPHTEISAAHQFCTYMCLATVKMSATTMALTIIMPTHLMPVELLALFLLSSFGFFATDYAASGEEELLCYNSRLLFPRTITTTILM